MDTPTAAPAAVDTRVADTTTTPQISESQEASGVSLDEYLEICSIGETETVETEEVPIEELAKSFRDQIELMESVGPPAEVAAWHNAVLTYQRDVAGTMEDYVRDPQGQSEDEFLVTTVFSLALRYQSTIDQAVADMAPDVRSRMVAAGCIDEEISSSTQLQEAREEIAVGSSITGTLEESDRSNTFQFQVENGKKYLIEVTWEGLPEIFLLIKDPPDPVVTNITSRDSEDSPLVLRWTAPESGTFHLDVNAIEGEGSYTISISVDTSPDTPAGLSATWKGSGVEITWDPVAGADYYRVYHDDFFETGCSADIDGNPRFCDQIAANVVGTSYNHASPDADENFYFVAACNSGGCSRTDANNPAIPTGVPEATPTLAPVPMPTQLATVTQTPRPTVTSTAAPTSTPVPTATRPPATTETPVPTVTPTAAPTSTPAPTPVPTPVLAATATPDPSAVAPTAPANVHYSWEQSAMRVTWDAVDGADYYNVYYDNFSDSNCSIGRGGNPRFCDELAVNVTSTHYLHVDPTYDRNYYWVVACNSGGCSEIDSEDPATPVVEKPDVPSGVTYIWEGSTVRVNWNPVVGADYYKVFYDDFFDSSCSVGPDGSPSFCDELATNVSVTTYMHDEPDEDQNYYWVMSCNRGGCSEIDSEKPAELADE